MNHRWVALGSSSMTVEEATGWADLADAGHDGVAVSDSPNEIWYGAVVCAVCIDLHGDASSECPGPPDEGTEHLWQAFFNVAVTDDEAGAWADPDAEIEFGRPQATNVICVLCGQTADSASAECEERVIWTKGSRMDLRPEDFENG